MKRLETTSLYSVTQSLVSTRITGIAGLLVLVTGSFSQYTKSAVIDTSDLAFTIEKIAASHGLFLTGIFSALLMTVCFIFYVNRLYQLFKNTNATTARLMLLLAIVPMPILLVNQISLYAVSYWAVLHDLKLMAFFLDIYKQGGLFIALFFGLWLIPLGLLTVRSFYFPNFLGYLLILGSSGYVVLSVRGFFVEQSVVSIWQGSLLLITHISELLFMLRLFFYGEPAAISEEANAS